MLKSLTWKLALAFLFVAFVTAGLVAMFIRQTSTNSLTRLIADQQRSDMVASLETYYAEHGSWEGIEENWPEKRTQNQNQPTQPDNQPLPYPPAAGPSTNGIAPNGNNRTLFGLADGSGKVLVSANPKYPVGSTVDATELKAGEAILVDGVQVGTMLEANQLFMYNPEEARFLERTNQALMLGMLGAMVVAIILGMLLSRSLTRPLNALTLAAQNITKGQLEQQVAVSSKDEIGELATAFNRMSQEVSRVNQMRRQMTADIAHDLRTPLTVIAGYVEAMRDGVLQPSTQRLSLIYTEIERLQNLVGDLRMLSQADAGELTLSIQKISPSALLQRAAELFQHHAAQNDVTLTVETPENIPDILIDEARMMQVLDNLIGNALRYTPTGGKITLLAECQDNRVSISVKDTGVGINPADLPFIFDRFYRVDRSRHTDGVESGLGLAIVKAFVEAQKGTIRAESTPGEGTTIIVEFLS